MAATTKFGTKAPIKKMFGTKEVLKEVLNGVTVYTNTLPVQPYLTFSSPNNFSISIRGSQAIWNGQMQWSQDTINWYTFNPATAISNSPNNGDIKYIYLRGIGNTRVSGGTSRYFLLNGTDISCTGNMETLLDYQTVENGQHPAMVMSCFQYLFKNCTALIKAPDLLSTTLSDYCYESMFVGCSNLIEMPTLAATTLARYCYQAMFSGCTNLTIIKPLPAVVLAEGCCNAMFYNCVNMEKLPALYAINMEPTCYTAMFYSCHKIKISATQTGEYQTSYIIPIHGTGIGAQSNYINDMFYDTGGTFKSTPFLNTTYYTSNEIVY